jgi:hypothetical protein
MLEVFLPGLLVLMLLVPAAVGVWFWLLRAMDKAIGVNFKERARTWSGFDFALYAGLRAVAVAILVGQLFSRFV